MKIFFTSSRKSIRLYFKSLTQTRYQSRLSLGYFKVFLIRFANFNQYCVPKSVEFFLTIHWTPVLYIKKLLLGRKAQIGRFITLWCDVIWRILYVLNVYQISTAHTNSWYTIIHNYTLFWYTEILVTQHLWIDTIK